MPGPGSYGALVEEAFSQCHLPVAIYDRDLRTLRASLGMARVLGVREDGMLGRRLSEIMPGPLCEGAEQAMTGVLASGAPTTLRVLGAARSGGRPRVWSVTLSPLRDGSGRTCWVQLTALDTTDQYWARERLALLNEVSARVGTTLDVVRTAQEMADVVTGGLADFVTVDLLEPLFHGGEPDTRSPGTGLVLRRAAHQSVLPGVPETVTRVGEVDHYPECSPPARCLATGKASLHPVLDREIRDWAAGDPARGKLMRTHGVHSVMVVPLAARGTALGVAVLARHRRAEPFDEDDLLLAEEVGARAAVAVDNARRYAREHATAFALQRSLLPHRLPANQAVQAASHYLPARSRAGVGGDWFDVIPLSGARVALVVGDVVGHGLGASATMGRLRSAVRALADVDLPPDELLVHLDDLVTHLAEEDAEADTGPEPGIVATCLYVVYDPVSCRCTAASAGHPPPVVVGPGAAAELLDLTPGPPLGVGGLPFETTERELDPGSLVVLYTDGLITAGGRQVDTGLDRLRAVLDRPAATPEEGCDAILADLLAEQPTDDVALLVARTRALAADQVATWDLPSDPAAVAPARARVADRLAAWGLEELVFTAELVVSELVTNAVRYGGPPVRLRLIRDATLICEVSDSSSTSPHLRRARTHDEGGRGLLLVAQLSARWGTRHTPSGKTIWAEIALPGGDPV
ncbi:SpoIIE family protein phosphatase [Streptacidiphilus sp. ASG 303]|uniref:SpoIIE family protein phosphatase n=1 Tax=Streptacidiphilus sp. ASG 303 TaxID=2896847 RepID=UPI001E31BEF4|nr:SpoIIE family protein phosphatase [Streptacidiphilus sp. ASG 303]MCD0484006.1 SpoIIE family protein phosphatase [Streptacidiphilus sp. ASG 303]